MRSALLAVMVLSVTVHADPFAVRQPIPGPMRPLPPDPEPPAHTRRLAGKITIASGLAIGVAGFALSLHEKTRFDNAAPNDDATRADARNTTKIWGSALVFGGLAAVVTGSVLWATDRDEHHPLLAPTVTPDQVGMAYSTTF